MSNTTDEAPKKPLRLLRYSQVLERIPYTRQHIARLEQEGKFPKAVRMGVNSIAFLEEEIDAWILAKRRESETTTVPRCTPSSAASLVKARANSPKVGKRQLATA